MWGMVILLVLEQAGEGIEVVASRDLEFLQTVELEESHEDFLLVG
jgi:hypothetical protein